MSDSAGEHRNIGPLREDVRGSTTKFRAACACGWRSPLLSTAGMAGTAYDRHAADPDDVSG